MRLGIIVLLSIAFAIVHSAPVNEKDDTPTTTVEPVTEISTSEPEEVPTTFQPETDDGDEERKARQLEEEDDDDDDADQEDDDDDDEEEEDADEEEEEERKLPGTRVPVKPVPKKKASQVERKTKPVPVLVDGVEDDEAEDLGIFEREDSKTGSSEKSDEDKSDEEKADDDNEDDDDDDDDDESGEDDDDNEESEPSGLEDEPSSNERGDVEEISASIPVDNNAAASNQEPLAIAVVQPEVEVSDPVVPIIVEESSKNQVSSPSVKGEKSRKNKPKKEEEDDEEDDDDDDDDDEEEDDTEKERSEKITKARSAYPSPVLYYYPFPETRVESPATY